MLRANNNGEVPFRYSPGKALQRLGLFFYFLVVLSPLLFLIAQAVPFLLDGKNEWMSLAVPAGRRLTLLVNSLGFAAAVAVGGMVLGTLAGLVLWRWDTGWRAYLRWLILVLAPVPPYIHALAWMSSIHTVNSVFQGAGFPVIQLQGWGGSWWVQLMALAPVAVGLSLVGLKSVEPLMIDAARVMRSDFFSVARVVLPLAAPALVAGGGVLFLLSLMDYSVPSLFNVNVYTLEIFAEYSASNEPVRALLLSLPLLFIAIVVLVPALSTLKNAASSPAWRVPAWKAAPVFPGWLRGLQWFAVAILVSQIAVPFVSLFASAGNWNNMASNIIAARNEISFTVWIDVLVSLLCIPLALAAAMEMAGSKKWGKALWTLVIAPVVIPPPLVGIGLITIWNRELIVNIYGTSFMPVLAGLARFAPLAVIVLVAQLRRIDPLMIDAARLLQTSRWQILKHIWLPMLSPGLFAAFGITFALTTGELGATLLVAPPGQATLTMRIYNFLHYGASDTVAALCFMMAISVLIAGAVASVSLSGLMNYSSNLKSRRK